MGTRPDGARGAGRVWPDASDEIALAGAAGHVAAFRGRLARLSAAAGPGAISSSAWDFRHLNAAYEAFLAHFSPFAGAPRPEPAQAFVLRSLLIHEYRRILLKDPQLPPALLPPDWAGEKARALAAAIYRSIAPSADRVIDASMEARLDPASASRTRFSRS